MTVLVIQAWLGAFILGPIGEPQSLALGSGGPCEIRPDRYLVLTTGPQRSGLELLVFGPLLVYFPCVGFLEVGSWVHWPQVKVVW